MAISDLLHVALENIIFNCAAVNNIPMPRQTPAYMNVVQLSSCMMKYVPDAWQTGCAVMTVMHTSCWALQFPDRWWLCHLLH